MERPVTKDFQFLQQKYTVNTYVNRGVTLVEGKGVYLWDSSRKKYLDLMTNYGVNIFGYAHPEMTRALIDQIIKLTNLHGSFNNDIRAEASQALVNRCGGGLAKVYFSSSGAEANEAALKFAILSTGKKKFIACHDGYHGKTLGALSATSGKKFRINFEPLLLNFRHIAYNNLDQLEASLDEDTAAFFVEPVQGEGGIKVPEAGYLRKAAEMCRSKNALLILDEIQTGVGRTGSFLASQDEVLSYDIVCLGKGLAGGLPVGATLVSPQIAEKIPRSSHTSTFGGNPLVGSGILATLRLIDEELLKHINKTEEYFREGLEKIDAPLRGKIHGRGLMLGVEVKERRDSLLKKLQEESVLAIPAGENMVRFLPSYILEKIHIDFALEKLNKAFQSL
jgi:acetylornithine/LysW-gamma-L-lysine aminotransferase